MPLVTSGVDHGNLRELALARMKDFGTECRDVRTREVGIQEIHNKVGQSKKDVNSGRLLARKFDTQNVHFMVEFKEHKNGHSLQ